MCQLVSEMANSNEANDYLKKIAENLEKNPPEDKNGGYKNLMQDVSELLYEAYNYEFDDFRNKKYDSPKLSLIDNLQRLIQLTKNGRYDN